MPPEVFCFIWILCGFFWGRLKKEYHFWDSMEEVYLIDTSIWMDMYEDRKGFGGEPLGDYALNLMIKLKATGSIIIITDLLMEELESNYSMEKIRGMLKPFESQTQKIIATYEQWAEAKKISFERRLPSGDVLHAIMARDNDAILITRDKHFRKIEDISAHYKPEEIT
jgi:predicted nucleic acid-binding protein